MLGKKAIDRIGKAAVVGAIVIWAGSVLATLAAVAGAIYIVVHFAAKYW